MPASLLKGPIAKLVASALKGAGMTLAATLIKVTPGTRTAGKISAGTNPTSTSYQCVGFVDAYSTFELAQSTVIRTDDRKICLLGATIQGGQIPRPTDKIFIDGLTYEIQNVSRDPASATYECQSRLSTLPVVVVPLPTAAFSSVVVGTLVTFSDLSFAPSGSIVAWSWAFGDGGTSTVQSPAHTYASGSSYVAQLTVTDTHGGTSNVSHPIVVNAPPIAAFTPTMTGLSLACVDASTDADGTIVTWSWAFGDGASSLLRNPTHIYASTGAYTVTLTVTDNLGATGTVSHGVSAAVGTPIASFTSTTNSLTVTLTDTSTDATATITAWAWTFGDGGTSALRNPVHVYAIDGTYAINLTVTDSLGVMSSASPASVSVVEVFMWPASQHVVILGDSNAKGNGLTDHIDDKSFLTPFAAVSMNEIVGTSNPFVQSFATGTEALQAYNLGGGLAGMGIELGLGRALYNAGQTATTISKWGAGGSSMSIEWIPSAGIHYPLVTAFLDARVAEFGPIGVVYLDLGTNDASTNALASTWQANAVLLMAALRARYGNFGLVVRLTSSGITNAYKEIVRQQQHCYVANDPWAILLDVDDQPISGGDGFHYEASDYNLIGARAAAEIVARKNLPAPAFVGASPEYVGHGAAVSGTGTLTLCSYPCPLVPISGRYVDLLVVGTGLVSGATVPTLTEPAGFIAIGSVKSTFSAQDQWLAVWYRPVTSRRMGNPVVADNNNINQGCIFTFRQPTSTSGSPVDVSVFTANNAAQTALSVAGATTTIDNDLIVVVSANYAGTAITTSAWANASLGSFTHQADIQLASGSDWPLITLATGTKAAHGVVSATTFTTSANIRLASATIAIKP